MDEKSLWKTVLAELQLTLTPGSYQTLFAKSKLVAREKTSVTIGLANSQIKNMVTERYYSLLKEIVDRITKEPQKLIFVVNHTIEPEKQSAGPLFEVLDEEQEREEHVEKILQDLHLRSDFTFENFAVSGSNQLAFAAASAVTKNPGSAYNPLYLWGGVGVGKTHLMQAVAISLLHKDPKTKIIYATSEEFTNEITMSIRNKNTDRFKNKYRNAQALLIDDIQFIAGKDTTQEEFFHTFNTVQREGGQVILTSDKPPHEIGGLEDRIRSRFEGGLVVDIQPPDLELRAAILLIKAKQKGIELPPGLAQQIAQETESARKLEGFLVKLINSVRDGGAELNQDLVRELLGKKALSGTTSRIEPKAALQAVCNYYSIKVVDLKGSKRKREVARPRQVLMWILRNECNLTLEEIGLFLGGRDHSTVIHGVEKISQMYNSSEIIKKDVLGIKQRMYG